MAIDFATLILNETPDAVIVTTPDGVVVCWTRGAQSVFRYSEEEALGAVLAELIVPAEFGDDERAVVRQTLEHGQANYESMRRAKDGTLVYIDSSSKAIVGADGAVQYILWSKKDVTHLKVLRDAKLIEARYGGLLDSTPDAIIMANASGRIVLVNTQAEALFGYARDELRGAALESLMPERLRHGHVGHRSGYFAQRPPPSRAMGGGRELYGLRKNGAEFPVEISLSPITTEEGMLIMSAIRDISERKRIELAVQERNVELAAANAAKDRFLAAMSHELRTPLNAILGFTGTLLMQLPGPVNGEQDKQLRTVQSSARHLLSLINDLLDLTRIEAGKMELDWQPVQCSQLVDEVLLMLKPQARQKNLTLAFRSTPHDIAIMSERRALQQILLNLLNNAIKFTEHGEVTVRLSTARLDGSECVTISVSDTGVGIMEERQHLLFQAFSQVDSGTTRQFEGTGLGLHLSQKLAALLGGQILFDSQFGVGSIFTLALPLDAPRRPGGKAQSGSNEGGAFSPAGSHHQER
ncbi:PAS domain S-box protein [Rugamonas sp.]|uniref:PAS domain S-box protein n=1 Tax=Rugamonas sp. TaxID=1926287 RepID=UPI0025F2E691|nr:PAS domain S-box protein [Rugamonas sp.]